MLTKKSIPEPRHLEGPETSEKEYSTRQIRICGDYFCSDIVWKVILKKETKHGLHKNSPQRFRFSLPRAFQWWSQNCRSPSGSLGNIFFVCSYWGSNPAVYCICPPMHPNRCLKNRNKEQTDTRTAHVCKRIHRIKPNTAGLPIRNSHVKNSLP